MTSPKQVQQTGLSSETQTTRGTVMPPAPVAGSKGTAIQPGTLQPKDFTAYPPEARTLAVGHLALLRAVPLPLLPVLLREIIGYDYKFPVERLRLQRQFAWLEQLAPTARETLFAPFAALTLSPGLRRLNWIDDPAAFMEQLTAELWSAGSMPAFRAASEAYARQMRSAVAEIEPARPRLCIVVLDPSLKAQNGRGATFAKLRTHGVALTGLKPEDGLARLLHRVALRATPSKPFTHWYVDGGLADPAAAQVTTTCYEALEPVRRKLLARAQVMLNKERSGPEELRSLMAQLRPQDVGLAGSPAEAVLAQFQLSLMTEGSGTQIFATTFVQWAAREILRRAEPETLLLRFQPRQRQQPMNELMAGAASLGPDYAGSLIDAEQAAYSTWLNLQRLPGAEQALLIAWQQGSTEAVALGPGLPAGRSSTSPRYLDEVLETLG